MEVKINRDAAGMLCANLQEELHDMMQEFSVDYFTAHAELCSKIEGVLVLSDFKVAGKESTVIGYGTLTDGPMTQTIPESYCEVIG